MPRATKTTPVEGQQPDSLIFQMVRFLRVSFYFSFHHFGFGVEKIVLIELVLIVPVLIPQVLIALVLLALVQIFACVAQN